MIRLRSWLLLVVANYCLSLQLHDGGPLHVLCTDPSHLYLRAVQILRLLKWVQRIQVIFYYRLSRRLRYLVLVIYYHGAISITVPGVKRGVVCNKKQLLLFLVNRRVPMR